MIRRYRMFTDELAGLLAFLFAVIIIGTSIAHIIDMHITKAYNTALEAAQQVSADIYVTDIDLDVYNKLQIDTRYEVMDFNEFVSPEGETLYRVVFTLRDEIKEDVR